MRKSPNGKQGAIEHSEAGPWVLGKKLLNKILKDLGLK